MFGKKRKPLNYRCLPTHALAFLWVSGLAAAFSCALDAYSIKYSAPEVLGTASLLQLGATAAALCVTWYMEWRDEIENLDGSRLGVVAVMVAAGELSGMVGLHALRGVAGAVGMLVLTWRNSLGLPVVARRHSLLGGRVPEAGVLALCLTAYYGLVLAGKLRALDGGLTAWMLTARAAATGAALVAMVANWQGERWPRINALHMAGGLAVLALADIVYAHALVLTEGSQQQVAVTAGFTALFTLALGLITSSAYRRTPAKASIL